MKPPSGIDPDALSEIFQFLISLKRKITVLMVTHDLQVDRKEMDLLFCIDRHLTPYSPEQICQHFALGLYHPKPGRQMIEAILTHSFLYHGYFRRNRRVDYRRNHGLICRS